MKFSLRSLFLAAGLVGFLGYIAIGVAALAVAVSSIGYISNYAAREWRIHKRLSTSKNVEIVPIEVSEESENQQ